MTLLAWAVRARAGRVRSEVPRKATPIQRVLCISVPVRRADVRAAERPRAPAITVSQDTRPLVDLPGVACSAWPEVAGRGAVEPATASRVLGP